MPPIHHSADRRSLPEIPPPFPQEATSQLRLQVRHAVEILVQSLDRADSNRSLPPTLLYEAALAVTMRLVFVLSAEERELLPMDNTRYAADYAISTLREQLQRQADQDGEEALERRCDAWGRLLAVFRAVYAGVHLPDLLLPGFGGSLFDPDRYPFLEGRGSENPAVLGEQRRVQFSADHWTLNTDYLCPLPVSNRVVLHLLDALQMLRAVPPSGSPEKRRLSFRALDVEQIGHVYEGLLDHTAARASEPILGLMGAKSQELAIPLSALEKMAGQGESAFLRWLKEQTGRSVSALKTALASGDRPMGHKSVDHGSVDSGSVDPLEDSGWTHHLRSACGDEALFRRVLPFAGLLRADDLGCPVVILPGSAYVTAGTPRRATGTHYTPRSLTEPVVQHALEPLVYEGPAEGWPREQWRLRPPAELLALKVCDVAMGSAGFLVQVVRYLSERLAEAWCEESKEGNSAERLALARRVVAERCIYGVDKNPLAVEVAKLCLWLVTLYKGLPFTFLDHALKCGDTLVSTSEADLLRWASREKSPGLSSALPPAPPQAPPRDREGLREQLEKARSLRKQLESFAAEAAPDGTRKEALLREADAALRHIRRGADLLAGGKLLGFKPREADDLLAALLDPYLAGELDGEIDCQKHPGAARALRAAQEEHCFHWEFEFPEVIAQGGFSAFVGNPPFVGGRRVRDAYGDHYKAYLLDAFGTLSGNADYCALFFLRSFAYLAQKGTLGFIATKTISQGDTRKLGLEQIIASGGRIYHVDRSQPWPGEAAVLVSFVHIIKGPDNPVCMLDGKPVEYISSFLDQRKAVGTPFRLACNSGRSYQGSLPRGMGFVITKEEASALLAADAKNREVVQPFLIGADLNGTPDQSPGRWVINFFDRSEAESEQYAGPMEIVRERVYPERMGNPANQPVYRNNWWRFWRIRKELYAAIRNLKQVIVISQATKYIQPSLVDARQVFDQSIIVIASDSLSAFGILNSSIHASWALEYQTSIGVTPYYIPTIAYQAFPFPDTQRITAALQDLPLKYGTLRKDILRMRQEGLTAAYNRFHNPAEQSADIARLRNLHVEMDSAVLAAYGWQDLVPGHTFHDTPRGVRFTISEPVRQEVLARLLQLNHERHAVEQGGEAINRVKEQTHGKIFRS